MADDELYVQSFYRLSADSERSQLRFYNNQRDMMMNNSFQLSMTYFMCVCVCLCVFVCIAFLVVRAIHFYLS